MQQQSIQYKGKSVEYYSEPKFWVFKLKNGIVKFSKEKHATIKAAVVKFMGLKDS